MQQRTANTPAIIQPAAAAEHTGASTAATWRLLLLVFFPFVTGYFLSYYFRTVNAVLTTRLVLDVGLDAAQLGLMTSAYFFMAAAAQLPIGIALDRYGPRRVQVCCLLIAATGAALFALGQDFQSLLLARALIGLGVAPALLAGLKAIAMCADVRRVGVLNGCYICVGAMGAIAASVPSEHLLASIDWRQLFWLLAAAVAASALLIGLLVPHGMVAPRAAGPAVACSYRQIYADPFFWRLAPLSASAIGSAWALQGLWSAPWLRDVTLLSQPDVAWHLAAMAIALSMGALTFGLLLQGLARWGITPACTIGIAALFFVLSETALALGWPISPFLAWSLIGAFGAATVLSYTMTAQRFPKEIIGRVNGALNLLHFGAAFAVQSLFGLIVAAWPRDSFGHYPPEAYRAALLALAAFQLLALLWFLRPLPKAAAARLDTVATMRLVAGADAPPRARKERWRLQLSLAACALLMVVAMHGFN